MKCLLVLIPFIGLLAIHVFYRWAGGTRALNTETGFTSALCYLIALMLNVPLPDFGTEPITSARDWSRRQSARS